MNPYFILAGVIALGVAGWQCYAFGHRVASNECAANAGAAARAAEGIEDRRDANIAGIGEATRETVAVAHAETKGAADASAEVIRIVRVPADCRDVPAVIVQEHAGAVDRINAKLRGGVRPGAAERDRAAPENGAGEVGVGGDPARPVRVGSG